MMPQLSFVALLDDQRKHLLEKFIGHGPLVAQRSLESRKFPVVQQLAQIVVRVLELAGLCLVFPKLDRGPPPWWWLLLLRGNQERSWQLGKEFSLQHVLDIQHRCGCGRRRRQIRTVPQRGILALVAVEASPIGTLFLLRDNDE